jgi:hypothetical protein
MKKTIASVIFSILCLGFGTFPAQSFAASCANPDPEFGCPGDYDKAVYDNAKSDGKSDAEASAAAGGYTPPASSAAKDAGSGEGGAYVYVTENIPGAGCTVHKSGGVDKRLYKCPVGAGFDSVKATLGALIKYATFITGLLAVLMIVVSGIQYSLSGGDGDMKSKAKGRIVQLLSGLVLLFLMGFILNSVAPWIYN